MPGESDLVNLDEIVLRFVRSDEMDDMDKKLKSVPKKSLDIKINWDEVSYESDDACFPRLSDDIQSYATSRVIHTQNFTNNTCTEQVYSYKTTKRKMAVCERSYQEGCTLGENVGMKFKVPTEVFELNVDLRQELSLMESERFHEEEELGWEVESQIRVPPKHRTVADLTISEKQYCLHFVIESVLKGDVVVDYKNLANGEVFSCSYINIATIIRYALDKKLLKTDQFEVVGDEDAVRTRFKGKCKFSKGDGDIKLTEKSLIQDTSNQQGT